MPLFSKESLENLRQRIDLVEVLSSHIELKRSGASYKALCPFHDEKSPSFVVQKGDSHYHCFGCGAHGDAIQFVIAYLKMGFSDAVEHLAQKFQVPLVQIEKSEEKSGPNKGHLKQALHQASRFFHFYLLHTMEGHDALRYLYQRGIDLDFIHQFQIGLAPKNQQIFRQMMHGKLLKDEVLEAAGLIAKYNESNWRPFFSDRITFPIKDATGATIGFSARKYKEETFGGKYINTSETALFKKSRILFGLNYCRRRIAKERKAIIVEGQIDALRLIQTGFNITVAGQGTAFGEGHVKELMQLGVNEVYLALDADEAGQEAACKIGNYFQKEGVEVRIVKMPEGSDPDAFLREKGTDEFLKILVNSIDYLTFLVARHSRSHDLNSPAGKLQLIQVIAKQIQAWDHPLMVHESLRKLAHLTHTSESAVGIGQIHTPNIYIKKSASVGLQTIDPDRILESDFLRWLLIMGDAAQFIELSRRNLQPADFHVSTCRRLYQTILECVENQLPRDLLSLAVSLDDAEGQLLMSELLQKKVNKERAEQQFVETIQKILDRNWMERREEIKIKIQSGKCSDEEVSALAKQFDELKRQHPQVCNINPINLLQNL